MALKSRLSLFLTLAFALSGPRVSSAQAPTQADDPPSTANAPFVASFVQGSKTLDYVAVSHHSALQYPVAMDDPTFKTIAEAFKDSPPDAVVIEGVLPDQLPGIEKLAIQCAQKGWTTLPGFFCDEPEFAAYTAGTLGIPVFTGEPADTAVLAAFKAGGYSEQDALAFYLMRDIPAIERDQVLTHDDFPPIATRLLKTFGTNLGTSVSFGFDDFVSWYSTNMPVPRDYLALTVNETGPDTGPGATILGKESSLDDQARDGNVVTTIAGLLESHDHILVVYGASHLDFEYRALEELLGTPTINKLY